MNQPTKKKIVRYIDIGESYTKFTIDDYLSSCVKCKAIPSMVARHQDYQFGKFARTNVICVTANQFETCAGDDVEMFSTILNHDERLWDGGQNRILFIYTLICAAISNMDLDGGDVIDELVLALPLRIDYCDKIVADISNRILSGVKFRNDGNISSTEISVKAVKFVHALHAGMLQVGIDRDMLYQLRSSANICVVIDVGFTSINWIAASNNRIYRGEFGSVWKGLNYPTSAVISMCHPGLLSSRSALRDVCNAFRKNAVSFTLVNRQFLTGSYKYLFDTAARKLLQDALGGIEFAAEVSNVVLVGGGAFAFRALMRDIFVNADVFQADDPMFSGTMGMRWSSKYFPDEG